MEKERGIIITNIDDVKSTKRIVKRSVFLSYKERQLEAQDYLLTVAEEIEMMLGLKTEVVNDFIEVDTIAGKIKTKALFNNLMEDVYRFIYVYGTHLHTYGLSKRIEESKKNITH